MRAAIFRNGEIVVDTLSEPKPATGQVLAKTLACGICGSDLHARKHAHRMVELSRHFPGRKRRLRPMMQRLPLIPPITKRPAIAETCCMNSADTKTLWPLAPIP